MAETFQELLQKAKAAYEDKRYGDAVQLCTEVTYYIVNIVLNTTPAFCILVSPQRDSQITSSVQALAENSLDSSAFLQRALSQKMQGNQLEALGDAQRATELDPKNSLAHATLGGVLFDMEEFESAKESYEMAAALEPTRKRYSVWVDMCSRALGLEIEPPKPDPTSRASSRELGAGSHTVHGPAPTMPSTPAATSVSIDDPEYAKYWKAPVLLPQAATTTPASGGGLKYRCQWFQTSDKVEVNILAKGASKEHVDVSIEDKNLRISILDDAGMQEFVLNEGLHGEVDPAASRYEILRTKIEVILKKKVPGQQWASLDAAGNIPTEGAAATARVTATAPVATKAVEAQPPAYAYAGKRVDWDALERQAKKEEDEEKVEGDDGAMSFFKKIFADSDDDTRRAMVKSYQESGGTALSTNWSEVGSKNYKEEKARKDPE